MRRPLALALALSLLPLGALPRVEAASFRDTAGHAYASAIESLRTDDIVAGYATGDFLPDARINRAEFLKIVLEARGTAIGSPDGCFPDVSEADWFSGYVCTAADEGIVAGYPDGRFRPEQSINAVEAAKILALAYDQAPREEAGDSWYAPYVRALEASRALPPSIERTDSLLTRGEMAEMVWRLRGERTDLASQGLLNLEHPEVTIDVSSNTVQRAGSCADLAAFASQAAASFGGYTKGMPMMAREANDAVMAPAPAEAAGAGGGGDYSDTNVQVEGVDEGDIVKTDGTFLYTLRGQEVTVVKAVPAEAMTVAHTLDLSDDLIWPTDLYVADGRLVVLGNLSINVGGGYPMPYEDGPMLRSNSKMAWPGYGWGQVNRVVARVYEVSGAGRLTLEREVMLDGSIVSSRLIGDRLALVTQSGWRNWGSPVPMPLARVAEGDLLPQVTDSITGEDAPAARCGDVFILPHVPSPQLLTVATFDLDQPTRRVQSSVVLGSADTVYSSLDNLYVGATSWTYQWDARGSSSSERTHLARFAYGDEGLTLEAEGSVPGHLLNQFAMDEFGGNLRVATTQSWDEGGRSSNNLYVLNDELGQVGEVEDLARGESIYAVRFMGERAYVVTFKQVDPLFVLDLSNPRQPKVLGELKIPGYSNYLHPIDRDHVLGIGKEVDPTIDADKVHGTDAVYYTAIQGVKLSVFDVSDVTKPRELFKEVIGERGTESPVLSNHRALLYEPERELLALPISVAKLKAGPYGSEPQTIWQGAYVYQLNLDDGFVLRGRISHVEDPDETKPQYWYPGDAEVQRIVRIGTSLYTLSNDWVQAHSEVTLRQQGSVEVGE